MVAGDLQHLFKEEPGWPEEGTGDCGMIRIQERRVVLMW